jgi:hypothetical protein
VKTHPPLPDIAFDPDSLTIPHQIQIHEMQKEIQKFKGKVNLNPQPFGQ